MFVIIHNANNNHENDKEQDIFEHNDTESEKHEQDTKYFIFSHFQKISFN